MTPRRLHTSTHIMRLLRLAIYSTVVCVALAFTPHAHAEMMDMPSDPVSGEMVMSTAFNYELKNGQRLRFASVDTLHKFNADPSAGLGEVKMVQTNGDDTVSAGALCPVCGMETSPHGGPQVLMKHGGQAIHACSMFHAHQVHDDIRSLQAPSGNDKAPTQSGENPASFCTGSGTTMLNGFTFFQDNRLSGPCLLLWFPGWVLNTPWKYLGGCLVVVLCAMMNEYLLKIRRILRKETTTAHRDNQQTPHGLPTEATKLLRPRAYSTSAVSPSSFPGRLAVWFRGLSRDTQHKVHSLLHGVTILVAYMLMLVSMTYDGILFLCCILGYVIGYYVFGERREAVDLDAPTFTS